MNIVDMCWKTGKLLIKTLEISSDHHSDEIPHRFRGSELMRHLMLLALFVTGLFLSGCSGCNGPQTTKPTGMGGPQSTATTKPEK